MNTDIVIIIFISSAVLFIFAVAFIFVLFFAQNKVVKEQALKISEIEKLETKYRKLFEHSLAGMIKLHIQSLLLYDANSTALRLFSCDTMEELQKKILSFDPVVLNTIRKSLEEHGSVYEKEIMLENKRWILFSAKWEDENIANCVMIDISIRKTYEEKIEEQAHLLDETQEAIIVTDEEGKIQYWNAASENIYGWGKEEILQTFLKDKLFTKNNVVSYDNAWEDVVRFSEWSGELRNRKKNGTEIFVESNWKKIKNKYSNRQVIMIINTDVTEKRRLELYSIRAKKMESITLLTSSIAHDLQNILAPMLMSVGLLRDDPQNSNNGKILGAMEQSTKSGLDLVKNILKFGRGIKGQKTTVELNAFLDGIVTTFANSSPSTVVIEKNIGGEKYYISADEQQLSQVFLNLLTNAMDAMLHNGTITVTLKRSNINIEVLNEYPAFDPEHFVEVEIQDTGIGISAEEQTKIFDPFYTTKTNERGTGLGLPIVQSIIKYHDGLVTVESAVGEGTVFHVFLPIDHSNEN